MRKLKLTFPYSGQRNAAVEYLLLALGLLALLAVIYQLKSTMADITYWEAREARMAQQQQHRKLPRTPAARISQATQQEIKLASDILHQLNLPWEKLFDSLELAASKEVALLSLQPNVASRVIRLSGEARNLTGLVEYVEALEREPVFKDTHLLNYKVRRDHPRRPIIFSVTTTWRASY